MNDFLFQEKKDTIKHFKSKALLFQMEEKVKGCKYFLNAHSQAYSSFPIITGSAGTHAAADPQKPVPTVETALHTHPKHTGSIVALKASALRPRKISV